MAIRLAIVGTALVLMGLLNLGGFGKITAALGAVVLLGAGIARLTRGRKSPTTRG